jgi:hypothetical protein
VNARLKQDLRAAGDVAARTGERDAVTLHVAHEAPAWWQHASGDRRARNRQCEAGLRYLSIRAREATA